MPDGRYKFWVQYAENNGQGPVTTSGLLWTKGPIPTTNTYPSQGVHFGDMKVTWSPVGAVPPTITSAAPTASGTVGVPYSYTCTASGTAPITFTATNLPKGLSISPGGVISGTPSAGDTFAGTITATNGTAPNATQPFSITVAVVQTTITSIQLDGSNLILRGTGPANGKYAVLTSTAATGGAWTPISTNTIGAAGNFSVTNAVTPGVPQSFYKLRIP